MAIQNLKKADVLFDECGIKHVVSREARRETVEFIREDLCSSEPMPQGELLLKAQAYYMGYLHCAIRNGLIAKVVLRVPG